MPKGRSPSKVVFVCRVSSPALYAQPYALSPQGFFFLLFAEFVGQENGNRR